MPSKRKPKQVKARAPAAAALEVVKPERDEIHFNVRLPKETARRLEETCSLRGATKSLLVREAIEDLYERLTQQPRDLTTVAFKGDEMTVEMKWKAIERAYKHEGICMIARALKTTRRSLEFWKASDPEFAELMQEAREESVERVACTLWQKSQQDGAQGQLTAAFGVLNAEDGRYGMVRKDYLDKALRAYREEVILPVLQARLTADQVRSIVADVNRRGREFHVG